MNKRRLLVVGGTLAVGAAVVLPSALATSAAGASRSSMPANCAPLTSGPHYVPTTKGFHDPYKWSGPVCTVMDAARAGIPNPTNGDGASDVSAIRLPDGKIRIYFCVENVAAGNGGNPTATFSAIASDGVHFTLEPGERVGNSCVGGAYRSPDGKYHLLFSCFPNGGVCSASSSDGLTFTQDPGVRIALNTFARPLKVNGGVSGPGCNSIVALSGGRYRMYCTQAVKKGNGYSTYDAVFSATSSNLLDWTPDRGRRLGQGTALTHDCEHPAVLASSSRGGVTLICWSGIGYVQQEIIARSSDGLNFTQEADTGISGTESSPIAIASGGVLLYLGGPDIGGKGSFAIDVLHGQPSR